jgi:hypothetical protein
MLAGQARAQQRNAVAQATRHEGKNSLQIRTYDEKRRE